MNWNKVSAIGTLLCLGVAIAALAVEVSKPDVKPWIAPFLLGIAVLGVACFFIVAAWRRFERVRRLPFDMLWTDCECLLSDYRKLAFEYPVDAKLPLNNASWPHYGEVWQWQHVHMFALRAHFFPFLFAAEKAWKERGWKDTPSLRFKDSNSMIIVDVIAHLEEMVSILKRHSA